MTGKMLRQIFSWEALKWVVVLIALCSLTACKTPVNGMLDPKGFIATEERKLFFDTLALMLIVVLPVIVMSITFVYHYRASHQTRDYKPNWSHSYFLESLWWGIPCAIIVVLAILTWKKTIQLDPYRKITANPEAPLVIQAIALPWKWLFIYPEQDIATVNYLVVPVGREVEYWFTTDNVAMSAFFVPQLGSQIYAMAGMRTRMYLLANEPGNFLGMNTMYNGEGFSDMRFMTHAVTPEQMQQWFAQMKNSPEHLTQETYQKLLEPAVNAKPQFFAGVPDNFFQNVINLYMNSSGPAHPRTLAVQPNVTKE